MDFVLLMVPEMLRFLGGIRKLKLCVLNALHLETIFIPRGLRQILTVVFQEGNPIKTFHTSIKM